MENTVTMELKLYDKMKSRIAFLEDELEGKEDEIMFLKETLTQLVDNAFDNCLEMEFDEPTAILIKDVADAIGLDYEEMLENYKKELEEKKNEKKD